MGPWAYGVLEGRQVDRWLASRAGWRADVLRDRTYAMEEVKRNLIRFEIESSKGKKKIKSSLWNLFSGILNLHAYKKK